jgi:ketosteroid isomerase-like protein
MKPIMTAVAAVFLVAGAIWSADSSEDLVRAEKAWAAAVTSRDYAALDRIFTGDLIYAHASGAVETKAQYIDRLRSGKQRYDSLTHENLKVVLYGETAVTHSTVRVTGKNDAGPFNDHVMMMHVWVKQGGTWRLAGHQTTRIP